MAEDAVNDHSTPADFWKREPDPYGQAAMLLVESLLHGLIANTVLSIAEAVEIVDVAANVKTEIGPELGDSGAALRKSLSILGAISDSLSKDIPSM